MVLSWEHKVSGNYDSAIFYGKKSLELATAINYEKGIGNAYSKLASALELKGDYSKAIEYYLDALKIAEKIGQKKSIAAWTGNIGAIYYRQGNFEKALEYYQKALLITEEQGNKNDNAIWRSNIGLIYCSQGKLDEALAYFQKALEESEDVGNKSGISSVLGNIGIVYEYKSDLPTAIDYYKRSLDVSIELNDKVGITTQKGNIGGLYSKQKKYADGELYLKDALKVAREIGYLDAVREWHFQLSNLYLDKLDFKNAFIHYKSYSQVKDTLLNEQSIKQITEMSTKYESEKREQQLEMLKLEQKREREVASSESKRQRLLLMLFAFCIVAIAFIAVIIFRSLRVTKKQKHIIELQKNEVSAQKELVEKQKHLVEEHQKEIIDSITYAKRLQQAILPPIEFIKGNLPNSFLLYKPKDIVAGDFYWMEIASVVEPVETPNQDRYSVSGTSTSSVSDIILFAAADCTGHGVPGAMVSVVCSNALNRAVKEFGLREPGKILDKTTDLVIETFEKSGTEVKDGMDISLLAYNPSNKTIQWSGSNNPLWYIRNNEVFEITADKQPIGKHESRKPFTTHEISYQEGSVFYLFTDGLPDQFGGPKEKKFMYKKFKDCLLTSHTLLPEEQHFRLNQAFEDWRGSLEQVDDVTVIGIVI